MSGVSRQRRHHRERGGDRNRKRDHSSSDRHKQQRPSSSSSAAPPSRNRQAPPAAASAADFIPDVKNGDVRARKKPKSAFCAKVEMRVDLPDLPCDGKLLRYPGDPSRLYGFCASALETRCKADLLSERDLGISIEAIDPDAYAKPDDSTMHPSDQRLIEAAQRVFQGERTGPARRRDSNAIKHDDVTWLRRPAIMSTALFSTSRTIPDPSTPQHEARAENLQPRALVESMEESFEHAKGEPKHRTKKDVVPDEVLPVFPNFGIQGERFSYVMFDRPPVDAKQEARNGGAMSTCIMRASEKARTKDLYVAPSSGSRDTVNWNGRFTENAVTVVPDSKDRHFFVMTKSAVFYSQLETRENLKRSTKVGTLSEEELSKIPESLKLE